EHLHHARRQETFSKQLDAERIIGSVGEGLRLADANIGSDALAASTDGQREGGDPQPQPAGARASPDNRVGHWAASVLSRRDTKTSGRAALVGLLPGSG